MAGLKRENDSAVFAKLKWLLQSCRCFRLRNVLTNESLERFVWPDVHTTPGAHDPWAPDNASCKSLELFCSLAVWEIKWLKLLSSLCFVIAQICLASTPRWYKAVIVEARMQWFVYLSDNSAFEEMFSMSLAIEFLPSGSFRNHSRATFQTVNKKGLQTIGN